MLADIIKYTQVADERIINVFMKSTVSIPEAEKLFSHILTTQHAWMKRIQNQPADFGIWDIHPVEKFESIHHQNFVLIKEVFESTPLNQDVTYINSKGDEYTSKVKDIIFHVLNHSTYHRAQVASIFKQNGLIPPVTDYIMLKRDYFL